MNSINSLGKIPSRLFLVFTALLIVALSDQPSLRPPFELFPHQDKLFHFIEFGGFALALMLNRDLFGGNRPRVKMAVAGMVWALADEIHQSFVPGRNCSVQDFLADSVGLLAGILLFSALFIDRE
jgi:VanZ family protein